MMLRTHCQCNKIENSGYSTATCTLTAGINGSLNVNVREYDFLRLFSKSKKRNFTFFEVTLTCQKHRKRYPSFRIMTLLQQLDMHSAYILY